MNNVYDNDLPIDGRSALGYVYTGSPCPLKCKFCYYTAEDNNVEFTSIMKTLITYKQQGFIGVEFSGGESSILPHFEAYLKYAKILGFSRISTITSGVKFKDYEFLSDMVSAGLNDILVSCHGYDAESYERITGNTTWSNILDTLHNLTSIKFQTRINCIINDDIGEGFVSKFFDFINTFDNIKDINFILINNFNKCHDVCGCDIVSTFIENLSNYKTDHNIKLRYFPYCKVDNLQTITYNYVRQVYDTSDWNVGTMVNNPPIECDADLYVINSSRASNYNKPDVCSTCIYSDICDGIKKGWDMYPAPIIGRNKATLDDL